MRLFPVNLDVNDKLCVVIGGGKVAARKVEALLQAGAKVRVISPEKEVRGERREASKNIERINRPYENGDLEGAFLAVAATDDEAINKKIAAEADSNKVLLNVVDQPALGDFCLPSVVRRGDLVVTISTSGRYPALSKKLRKHLEKEFGPEYKEYLELLGQARNKVIVDYADLNKRKEKLQKIADLPLIKLIKQGKVMLAREKIERIVNSKHQMTSTK